MTLLTERESVELVLARTRVRLLQKKRKEEAAPRDVVSWNEQNFYIPETGKPIQFRPFQAAVLLYAFPPRQVGFRFSLVVLSSVKKSGKTTLAAAVGRWVAEERTRFGEVYCLGNDLEQAKERSFAKISQSVKLAPGYLHKGAEGVLPERWLVQKTKLECLRSGTVVQAVSVDAKGEAGGNQDLTIWTELWGFESADAVKFFEELTPVPTKPSCRLVETYAGFDGESELLRGIYDRAMSEGRQLTAGELAEDTGIPLGAFEESPNPNDLVPIWVNEAQGLFCYWDSGEVARRMTWRSVEETEKYYREQEATLTAANMVRLHSNLWASGEGDFIPMTQWDACQEALPPLEPGDRTPAVLAVDAATSYDCFGVVLLTRHPERPADVAIRHCRIWKPPKGGKINYSGPEGFIRTLCQGGCRLGHPQREPWMDKAGCPACAAGDLIPPYNIIEVTYDPYQLVSIMQQLYREGVNAQPFSQGTDRLIADSQLYDLIMNLRIAHTGQADLREHIQNAAAKQSKEEDTKLRIVKKEAGRKIDLAVAVSMGSKRILYFQL